MAITGNTATVNTVANLQQAFKKTQTGMLTALQAVSPEMGWLRKTPSAKLIPSGLEMRLILNVLFQQGGAMIPDGGYESTMTVAAPQYGTTTFVQYNGRFGLTGLGRMYDQFASQGEVIKLNMYAAMKVLEGMGRKVGMQFYGYSTGTVAVVDTTVTINTTGDVLLKQAFGSSLIGNTNATASTNQLTYLAQLFRGTGNVVAPLNGSALRTNGQATVNSVSNSAGSINVTTPGSCAFTAGDPLVFFNAVTDTSIAGTEYNLWPNGLLDATQSSSLHGLATSSAPNWAAYNDTSGGRFGFVKLRKGQQYANNYGGVEPDNLIVSNGVQNDMTAAERAARIYSGTSAFDLNGNIGAKGIDIKTSLLAPPALAFHYNSEEATKLELGDLPSDNGSPDLFVPDKLPNQDQWAFALNYAYLRAYTNRAALGCYSGLSEQ